MPEPEDQTIVRVSIKENTETGRIAIESTHPLPELRSFIDKLSLSEKRVIKPFTVYSLETIIIRCKDTIPYKRWADLLLEAITLRESNKLGVTAESHFNGNNATYIAVGDTIYEMAPIRVIPPSKAFINTRNLLLTDAHTKAVGIVSAAEETRERILAEAQQNANTITEVAIRLRRRAQEEYNRAKLENNKIPPLWLVDLGMPISRRYGLWSIQLTVHVIIESFAYEFDQRGLIHRGYWKTGEMEPLQTYMWLPINDEGAYSITSLCMDEISPQLPHISYGSACLGIDGLPPLITCIEHVHRVETSIERCIKSVQLNSLYVGVESWLPIFEEIIPAELCAALKLDKWPEEVRRLTIEQNNIDRGEEVGTTWQIST